MAAPLTHHSPNVQACRGCGRINGKCSLRCPTLQLPRYWSGLTLDQKYGSNILRGAPHRESP